MPDHRLELGNHPVIIHPTQLKFYSERRRQEDTRSTSSRTTRPSIYREQPTRAAPRRYTDYRRTESSSLRQEDLERKLDNILERLQVRISLSTTLCSLST